MKDIVTVRPSQLAELLQLAIQIREPVLVTGAPGVGKSDIVYQACAKAGAALTVVHPVVSDPTDFKGVLWPDKENGHCNWLLPIEVTTLLEARTLHVCFIDDLGQSLPAVQASFMRPLLPPRAFGGKALPDCVVFIAATNRRIDRAGVSGLLEPVKSRFGTIVNLEPHLCSLACSGHPDTFVDWWTSQGLPAEVLAFLRFKPDLFHDFHPTADLTNSPSPRMWAKVGKWLNAGLPRDLETPTIAGAVGVGAAAEFIAFLKVYRELPDPDEIIKAPNKALIPKEPSTLYAIAGALASRASPKTFPNILRYVERLREAGFAEFGVLIIRDSYRRDNAIGFTKAFMEMSSQSDYGKIMDGRGGEK